MNFLRDLWIMALLLADNWPRLIWAGALGIFIFAVVLCLLVIYAPWAEGVGELLERWGNTLTSRLQGRRWGRGLLKIWRRVPNYHGEWVTTALLFWTILLNVMVWRGLFWETPLWWFYTQLTYILVVAIALLVLATIWGIFESLRAHKGKRWRTFKYTTSFLWGFVLSVPVPIMAMIPYHWLPKPPG